MMRRSPITLDDIHRWKTQGLGQGEGANYQPWIDVRCFSSRGRMSRRPGTKTGRTHHLFSDNEDHFFLIADYAVQVVDIREQFPLFPESSTQKIAQALGISHPRYPNSTTPLVMTTDFLLTMENSAGVRTLAAESIKSAEELRGRKRKSTLAKLEIERRYWLYRGIPWHLTTDLDFDDTLIDNLDWLNYLTVENDLDARIFAAHIPSFLSAFSAASTNNLTLKGLLRDCASALGGLSDEMTTQLFRYCTWHHFIRLDLSVPIAMWKIPSVLSIENNVAAHSLQGDNGGYASAKSSL